MSVRAAFVFGAARVWRDEVIRRAFRLAIEQGILHTMPTVKALREDNAREGFLEPEQVEAVIAELPHELQDLTRFASPVAWRRREVTRLRWKDVDLANGVLFLTAKHSKNYRKRTLPLEGTLREILERRSRERAVETKTGIQLSEFVFHRRGKEIKDFRETWNQAVTRAGYPGTHFHDLRRSGVRNLVRSGVSGRIAMGISGHVTRSIFDRYDIVSEDDLRNALRKTDEYVSGKTTGETEDGKPRRIRREHGELDLDQASESS